MAKGGKEGRTPGEGNVSADPGVTGAHPMYVGLA